MFDAWLPLLPSVHDGAPDLGTAAPSSDVELAPQAQIEGLDPPAIAAQQHEPPPPIHTHILLGDGRGVVQPGDPWLDSDWGDQVRAGLIVDNDQDAAASGEGAGSSTGGPGLADDAHVFGHSDGRLSDAAASGASSFPHGGHGGYAQDAVDNAHGEHGTTTGGGSGNASNHIHLNPNASAYLGVHSSESAVSADSSCFKFDDVFSYHFHAGTDAVCSQSSGDRQLVHDYVGSSAQLAPPPATSGAAQRNDMTQMCSSPQAALAPAGCASADGPVSQSVANREARCKASRASPAHLVLATHAITLATMQGISKGDMTDLGQDAVLNAQSVTPVGAFIVHELLKENERVCTSDTHSTTPKPTERVVEVRNANFFRRRPPLGQAMTSICPMPIAPIDPPFFPPGTVPSHHR